MRATTSDRRAGKAGAPADRDHRNSSIGGQPFIDGRMPCRRRAVDASTRKRVGAHIRGERIGATLCEPPQRPIIALRAHQSSVSRAAPQRSRMSHRPGHGAMQICGCRIDLLRAYVPCRIPRHCSARHWLYSHRLHCGDGSPAQGGNGLTGLGGPIRARTERATTTTPSTPAARCGHSSVATLQGDQRLTRVVALTGARWSKTLSPMRLRDPRAKRPYSTQKA